MILRRTVIRYGTAIALVIAVIEGKSISDLLFGPGPALILFLSAVMFASRFCGFGPGLLTTFLSSVVCVYLYFEPAGSFEIHSANDGFRLFVFLAEGVTLCVLMQSLHFARQRAEDRARQLLLKERTVLEGEERFHLLVNSVQEYAIIMLDPTGHVASWNAGAERIKGYQANEIIGQHFSVFYPPEFVADGTLDRVLASVGSGERFEGTGLRVRKDGSTFWANVTISAVRDAAGELKGFAKVTRDITSRHELDEERRQVSEQLAQARDEALEASRVKSEFLANMSHEIRTPMNGVLGMTELVLDTELTRDQRESMEIVRSSAESLLVVINDILDFSKIEAGKLDLDLVEFELHELIEDTLKTLALRAHRKGLELTCEIDPEVPQEAIGDPHRLRQIFVNLVGNAIKFTERGEVVVHVSRSGRSATESQVSFAVTDTGIGIPADKQHSIFDPFAQVDGSMTRRHSGTGLGLTISSRLVALMGGRLEVESKIGLGSTFHFTVNLAELPESAARTNRDSIDLKGLAVLVVDDNATNRRIFDGILKNWGANPTSVESGQEAILELKRATQAGVPYPLLLVDAMMPEMDGFMLVEQIKQETNFTFPAIMMLTSADQQGDANRCRVLGMSSYLVKPIKSQDLKKAITTALANQLHHKSGDAGSIASKQIKVESLLETSLRVLVAEDNPVNQKVAVRFLEKQGHRVTVVDNGTLACDAVSRDEFDLVLMDLQMPEMNGLEAAQAIRAAEAGTDRHLPIVALTAHAMKGDRERCLAAGMDDYISKPIKSSDLLRVTQSLKKQTTNQLEATAESPTSTEEIPFDREAALANFDGDEEFLAEIITTFLDNLAPRMDEIRTAFDKNDLLSLSRAAHTLRGAASNLEARLLTELASELEMAGSQNNLLAAAKSLAAVEAEVVRLADSLASDHSLASCEFHSVVSSVVGHRSLIQERMN